MLNESYDKSAYYCIYFVSYFSYILYIMLVQWYLQYDTTYYDSYIVIYCCRYLLYIIMPRILDRNDENKSIYTDYTRIYFL